MDNFIIIAVVGLIVGLAAGYIYRERKKGIKCIGCPDGATCPSAGCGGCSGCTGCGSGGQR